jgi:hypothetical protein
MNCVDTDHGCGIIHFTNPGEGNFLDNFQNGYYSYNQESVMNNLNLISPDEFLKKYSERLLKI